MNQIDTNQLISNLKTGQNIQTQFLLYDFSIKETKTGNKYLSVMAQDRTGTVSCKMWSIPNTWSQANVPEKATVCNVKGIVEEFNGEPQLRINAFDVLSDRDEDIVPFTLQYISEEFALRYVKSMKDLVNKIADEELRYFIIKVFTDLKLYDSNESVILSSPFVQATAALKNHHCGWGGLLVHSYNTAIKAYTASTAYKKADKDICIAGALLHDIGKMASYTTDKGALLASVKGDMLEHTVLGITYLERYREFLSSNKLMILQHIIASHHGIKDYGAVVEPMTIEALIVSQADMGDFTEEIMRKSEEEKGANDKCVKLVGKRYLTPSSTELLLKE